MLFKFSQDRQAKHTVTCNMTKVGQCQVSQVCMHYLQYRSAIFAIQPSSRYNPTEAVWRLSDEMWEMRVYWPWLNVTQLDRDTNAIDDTRETNLSSVLQYQNSWLEWEDFLLLSEKIFPAIDFAKSPTLSTCINFAARQYINFGGISRTVWRTQNSLLSSNFCLFLNFLRRMCTVEKICAKKTVNFPFARFGQMSVQASRKNCKVVAKLRSRHPFLNPPYLVQTPDNQPGSVFWQDKYTLYPTIMRVLRTKKENMLRVLLIHYEKKHF